MHESFAEELIDKYDGFILDQFGVLHNGLHALDGTIELLEYLAKNKNKKLIVLSNTSAPSEKCLEKLPKFGFERSHFVGAVTSGEEASKYILRTFGSGDGQRSKALMLTWDAEIEDNPRLTALPKAFVEKCGNIDIASTVEEADFLLVHGSEVWYRGDSADGEGEATSLGSFIETGSMTEVLEPLLQQCLSRNIPCVCANPDLIVQTPSGGKAYMPGNIAQRYQDMGGTVHWFGKPQAEHFLACLQSLDMPADRVCHVGDSLHHDIAGAVSAAIPSIFVASTGIHLSDFTSAKFGELPRKEELDDLIEKEGGNVPTHVIPAFRLASSQAN